VALPAWLGKVVADLIGGPIVKALLDGYKATLDARNTRDHQAVDLAKADIEASVAHSKDRRDLGIAAMSHPVWWIAWSLFVIPPGLHHAAIYLMSTLGIGPDQFAVLAVPTEQKAMTREIVSTIFFLQGGSGIAGAVIQRLTK
jgi:hypothetical protein